MRKILAALLLVAFAATASFGAALGAGSGAVPSTESGRTVYPNLLNLATQSTVAIGKLSTGVYLSWKVQTTEYAIKTLHSSGMRMFGTASDSTAINWHLVALKGEDNAEPTQSNTSAYVTGAGAWSVM